MVGGYRGGTLSGDGCCWGFLVVSGWDGVHAVLMVALWCLAVRNWGCPCVWGILRLLMVDGGGRGSAEVWQWRGMGLRSELQ